jgi:hypothetical protein
MYSDLSKDINISGRFNLIIETISKEIPSFDVLNGGKSYKTSSIYQKLWTYHLTLVNRW